MAVQGLVNSLAISPDGKMLVKGTQEGELALWKLPSGRQVWSKKLEVPVRYVPYSSDGLRVASAAHGKTAEVWNAKDGTEQQYFEAAI